MTGWTRKVFWTRAEAVAEAQGFAIRLDGRAVKTPAKAPLLLPGRSLAQAVAAEWAAQTGTVRPQTMPLTRLAQTAIDKVAPQRAAVAEIVAAYGGSDLLCYRAAAPRELVARQAAGWDPLLDWAATALSARLTVTAGIVPVPQPAAALAALSAAVHARDPFALAALHDLVAITGSLVLGLAVQAGRLTADAAHALSRIDEDWQAEHWGADEEAAESAARKAADMAAAGRFSDLCASQDC
jgi:chaperone required for assembly of F1-ATPase